MPQPEAIAKAEHLADLHNIDSDYFLREMKEVQDYVDSRDGQDVRVAVGEIRKRYRRELADKKKTFMEEHGL